MTVVRAAASTLHVETTRAWDPLNQPKSTGIRQDIQRAIHFLIGTIGGAPGFGRRTVFKGIKRARGKVTVSGGSGTVTVTVNGVAVSSQTAGTDTATAAQAVADINGSSNALVQYFVDAASDAGSFALASVPVGAIIECCGYFLKAVGAATSAIPGEFDVSGNDAADAAALAAAINALPGLNEIVFAEVVSGHRHRAHHPAGLGAEPAAPRLDRRLGDGDADHRCRRCQHHLPPEGADGERHHPRRRRHRHDRLGRPPHRWHRARPGRLLRSAMSGIRSGNMRQFLGALSGTPEYLGTISTTDASAKNQSSTSSAFTIDPGEMLLIAGDQDFYVLPVSSASGASPAAVTAANGVPISANERVVISMKSDKDLLSILRNSSDVNVKVWRLR
jgi:hypothetical protein